MYVRSKSIQLAVTMMRPPDEHSMHRSGGLRALNLSLNSYRKALRFYNTYYVVCHGPALEQIARDSANASCIARALLAHEALQSAIPNIRHRNYAPGGASDCSWSLMELFTVRYTVVTIGSAPGYGHFGSPDPQVVAQAPLPCHPTSVARATPVRGGTALGRRVAEKGVVWGPGAAQI